MSERPSAEQLASLLEGLLVGVVAIEAENNTVTLSNTEFERIMGASTKEGDISNAIGRAVVSRLDGTLYKLEDFPWNRALQNGEIVNAEEVFIDLPDGHRIAALIGAAPSYDNNGHITAAIAVIQDVSRFHETERLRHQFLDLVSHEFRSPLAAIQIALEMAKEDATSGNYEEVVVSIDGISHQTERLLNLANNLLNVSQMETGSFTVQLEPFDLRPILSESLVNLAKLTSVAVQVHISEDLPLVNIDPPRVAQVFDNLLNNASKFAAPGTSVTVSADRTGQEVTIKVTNYGEAIPPENIPSLFRKFSQLHRGAGRRSSTGLGLVICKGIVEAHGGQIWVESSVEKGETSFIFTLPLASASK